MHWNSIWKRMIKRVCDSGRQRASRPRPRRRSRRRRRARRPARRASRRRTNNTHPRATAHARAPPGRGHSRRPARRHGRVRRQARPGPALAGRRRHVTQNQPSMSRQPHASLSTGEGQSMQRLKTDRTLFHIYHYVNRVSTK